MSSRPEMVRNSLIQAVNYLSNEFQANPGDFLYEADLRCVLYSMLREEFRAETVKLDSIERDFDAELVRDRVNPVKAEWPADMSVTTKKKTRDRFDVAILSSNMVESQNNLYKQPAIAAVEIKLWQPDGTGGQPEYDINKLTNYGRWMNELSSPQPFIGLSMVFVHPTKPSELAKKRIAHLMKQHRQLEELVPLSTGWLGDDPNGVRLVVVTKDKIMSATPSMANID